MDKAYYYEDVDRKDRIVRKGANTYKIEWISKESPTWKEVSYDGSYAREIFLGQGNCCLFSITEEEALKRLAEWGVE